MLLRILVYIFLPKSKSILLGILHRPYKPDFVNNINNVFTETGILNKQEYYLLGDLNIDLLLQSTLLGQWKLQIRKIFKATKKNWFPRLHTWPLPI